MTRVYSGAASLDVIPPCRTVTNVVTTIAATRCKWLVVERKKGRSIRATNLTGLYAVENKL